MAIPKTISKLTGSWNGISHLNLTEDPAVENIAESDSRMKVEADPQGQFATITYTWSWEGEEQYGSLLVCGNQKLGTVTGGWVDSWHQSGEVMFLTGDGMGDEHFGFMGSYGSADEPKRGWRIGVTAEGETLAFEMTHISPEGEEAWAVRCDYTRT
jgi:hypothetical protein